MEEKRLKLWQMLLRNNNLNEPNKDYDTFTKNYFSNEVGVKNLYNFLIKTKEPGTSDYYYNNTLTEYYKKFICGDLDWAKSTTYCSGASPVKTDPVKTDPVIVVPKPSTSRYTSCPETFPIKQFCKNETIRKVQGCLGIKTDSMFGPITQSSLEAKGLPGTVITQNSVDKACKGSSPITQKEPEGEETQQNHDPTDASY